MVKIERYRAYILLITVSLSLSMERPPRPGWGQTGRKWAYKIAGNLGIIETDPVKRLTNLIDLIYKDKAGTQSTLKALNEFSALLKEYPQLVNEFLFYYEYIAVDAQGRRTYHQIPITLLMFLMRYPSKIDSLPANSPFLQLIHLTIEAGAQVNKKNNNGSDALLFAIGNIQPAIIQILLESAVNIETRDNSGRTPLLQAIYEMQKLDATYPIMKNRFDDLLKIIQLLLKEGVMTSITMENEAVDIANQLTNSNFRKRVLKLLQMQKIK